jgi:hypothetical protein
MSSVIVDTAPVMASLRSAIAVMFQLDPGGIEIVTTGGARGTTPLLGVEVRIDGAAPSSEVRDFINGIFAAAHVLADMKAGRQ